MSSPRCFTISFSQYGLRITLLTRVTICSLCGWSGSPPYFSCSFDLSAKSSFGILALVNLLRADTNHEQGDKSVASVRILTDKELKPRQTPDMIFVRLGFQQLLFSYKKKLVTHAKVTALPPAKYGSNETNRYEKKLTNVNILISN